MRIQRSRSIKQALRGLENGYLFLLDIPVPRVMPRSGIWRQIKKLVDDGQ